MVKTWKFKDPAPPQWLDRFPEINRVVLQLLYNREISEERIESFLNPEYSELHSPFKFTDMEKAAERTWDAIEKKESIFIYSDYDADAVTANAVLQQTFRYLGVKAQSYIPDRFTEGYGLNVEAFKKIKAAGGNVVVTVDCGTNSTDVAEYCRENNIDLIITDHHEITGETPKAFALINPKNPADFYPDNQITGVGVAYKLAKAILSKKDKVMKARAVTEDQYVAEWDKWLLDLVAIGTVADCHSLLGENRILVTLGLKVLAKTKWIGLRVLMENAGLELRSDNLDARTLGFVIAPRINAAGRLEHADVALNLVLTQDFAEAIELSNRLEEINRRRRDMTTRIVSEAKAQAELILDRKVLLVSHAEWPKGLVGLVAGKLAQTYRKPVVVLEQGEIECTGSVRTSGNFDVVECLKSSSHLLVKYGGHKQAAGLTIKREHLDVFYKQILKFADDNIYENEDFLEVEAELKSDDLTMDTAGAVEHLEPYGAGNPKPILGLKGVQLASYRLVGASEQHIQLQLYVGSKIVDAIGFNMAYLVKILNPETVFDVAFELLLDSWNGMQKLKLKLIDVQVQDTVQKTS